MSAKKPLLLVGLGLASAVFVAHSAIAQVRSSPRLDPFNPVLAPVSESLDVPVTREVTSNEEGDGGATVLRPPVRDPLRIPTRSPFRP